MIEKRQWFPGAGGGARLTQEEMAGAVQADGNALVCYDASRTVYVSPNSWIAYISKT